MDVLMKDDHNTPAEMWKQLPSFPRLKYECRSAERQKDEGSGTRQDTADRK